MNKDIVGHMYEILDATYPFPKTDAEYKTDSWEQRLYAEENFKQKFSLKNIKIYYQQEIYDKE